MVLVQEQPCEWLLLAAVRARRGSASVDARACVIGILLCARDVVVVISGRGIFHV